VSACIDVLSPNVLAKGVVSAGYPVAPDIAKPVASYSLQIPAIEWRKKAEFWFAIRVGCHGKALVLSEESTAQFKVTDGSSSIYLE